MDTRIDPVAQLGYKAGEVHVIRNAGGRAQDALRSLIVSQTFLQTNQIIVYHHTQCGMHTSNEAARKALQEALAQQGPVAPEVTEQINQFEFKPFYASANDLEEGLTVMEDVRFLREHPLLLHRDAISGRVHNVDTGAVTQFT
ncbi:hypothetical protein FRB94_007734 [Tulasnella sp. JGI-2019a]|nr:hypothetical protein FRB94_007734 [Tulasnella sp. JGI-2019a]